MALNIYNFSEYKFPKDVLKHYVKVLSKHIKDINLNICFVNGKDYDSMMRTLGSRGITIFKFVREDKQYLNLGVWKVKNRFNEEIDKLNPTIFINIDKSPIITLGHEITHYIIFAKWLNGRNWLVEYIKDKNFENINYYSKTVNDNNDNFASPTFAKEWKKYIIFDIDLALKINYKNIDTEQNYALYYIEGNENNTIKSLTMYGYKPEKYFIDGFRNLIVYAEEIKTKNKVKITIPKLKY